MKIKNACFALLFWTSLRSSSITYAQITGSGTTDFIPLWTSSKALGDSAMFQTGGRVGIGTRSSDARLNVVTISTTTGAITGNANAGEWLCPWRGWNHCEQDQVCSGCLWSGDGGYGMTFGVFGVYRGGGSLCGHAGINPISVLANEPAPGVFQGT